MIDRLNQELHINDLVLISHPKTSALLRCIVTKINPKTIVVNALPSNEKENEVSRYNQDNMSGIGDGKWHGNYWRETKGFQKHSEDIIKIGRYVTVIDECKEVGYSVVEIGDEEMWPGNL